MTAASSAGIRSRLYEAYASQHARPAETGALRGHIVTQNLTFAARQAAEITRLAPSC